jgi:hypothetical protein
MRRGYIQANPGLGRPFTPALRNPARVVFTLEHYQAKSILEEVGNFT